MVLCKYLDGPMVELTQPYPNVLKYDNKLYEIDKDIQKSFVLDSVCSINADADSLYTMFYIGHDGTVSEAVHLRCARKMKAETSQEKREAKKQCPVRGPQ